jgi:hypothetical protein
VTGDKAMLKMTLLSLGVIGVTLFAAFALQGWSGVVEVLPSLITGGLGVAIASAVLTERIKDRERRAEFVKAQLQNLYGPLKFLTDWSVELYDHANNIQAAYKTEYIEQEYSRNPATQQVLSERSGQTLDVANRYVRCARENSESMRQILRDNYHLLEANDIELVTQFLLDHTRIEIEKGEGGLEVPVEVLQRIGNIPGLRSEFVQMVNTRFVQKQSEWKSLIR